MLLGALTLTVVLPSVSSADPARVALPAPEPVATFSSPPNVGAVIEPLDVANPDLPHGYVERELFASGTASAYAADSTPANGRWTVSPTTSAAYTTRVIVRRPKRAADFNGTVVVEWTNQSSGESVPDWAYLNPQLARSGAAYVAVTAQALAIDGGTSLLGSPVTGLRDADPARYGALDHPGDQYSYDILDQVGRALRAGADGVLGNLEPRRVVAVGESQSSFFLTTYANTLQARNGTFDGLFLHSRAGAAATLDGVSIGGGLSAPAVRVRDDLDVPVFVLETETDLVMLGYAAARQPDNARIRTWEVAGTAHADSYIVGGFAGVLGCDSINEGPQHLVAQAAFAGFTRWVAGGRAPSRAARLQMTDDPEPAFVLDAVGNVRGGVRTPAVDAPTSVLSGIAPAGVPILCQLFGTTEHLGPRRLVRLYGTERAFLSEVRDSMGRAVRRGFVLRADRADVLRDARTVASWVPGWHR